MMTTYSPLKKIAAFGFAAMVPAACAAPSYTTGSASSSASGGSASAKYLVDNVGDRVFFETDRSVLDASARGTLVQQAEWLNQNGGINMTIEGHADERGTREYNLALGERRATVIAELFQGLGIDPSAIRVVSYGEERPVALGHDDNAWAMNRRVEILY